MRVRDSGIPLHFEINSFQKTTTIEHIFEAVYRSFQECVNKFKLEKTLANQGDLRQ